MSETRDFHVADLVTVTSGYLLSPRGVAAMYDVIDFVTGQPHWTHQLPRAAETVGPELLRQLPWLADIPVPKVSTEAEVITWAAAVAREHGEMHTVTALPEGSYVGREPVAELREMAPDKPMLVVGEPPADPSPAPGRPAETGETEVARELRGWAEDIDNECWSLAALPRALRERADELAALGEGTSEDGAFEHGYHVHLDHCLRIVDMLWSHGWDGRADVVGAVRDALAASPRPVPADTEGGCTDPHPLFVTREEWCDGYGACQSSTPQPVSGAAVPDGAPAVGALIETVDELDRLPVMTVVRDADYDVCERIDDDEWRCTSGSMSVSLPARVIDPPGAPVLDPPDGVPQRPEPAVLGEARTYVQVLRKWGETRLAQDLDNILAGRLTGVTGLLDVPATSPLAEVATLLDCTPDQVPARVRGLLDEQRADSTAELPKPDGGPYRQDQGDALAHWSASHNGDDVWALHDGSVLTRVLGGRPSDPDLFGRCVLAAHLYRPEGDDEKEG